MIRVARISDAHELLIMRKNLFDDCTDEELQKEINENFRGNCHPYFKDLMTFVYEQPNGRLGAFIDVSIVEVSEVIDNYNNCYEIYDGKGLLYVPRIEAWYVNEDLRGKKIGKELIMKAEAWAIEKGCNIILSDTDTYREVSKLAHQALGYKIVNIFQEKQLIVFIKHLLL